jgi:transketolase
MRVDFVQAVTQLIVQDTRGVFITGDLGFNALEGLSKLGGKRFVNAGVAEQHMVGFAAGLALSGYRPWVYSIAPFVTYRCLEQIRNDVCLHNLPVRLVGNGGGFTYGIMGSTHHALEDLAVLKSLPNMQLFFPCSNDHVAAAVKTLAALAGPSYLRLAISGYDTALKPLAENPATLTRRYARGTRWSVVGIGHGVQVALAAVAQHGLQDVDLFGLARFPLDLAADADLLESVNRTGRVLVVDEHYLPGSIAESLKLALPPCKRFEVLSATYRPEQRYGSARFHLRQTGLTPEAVLEVVAGA